MLGTRLGLGLTRPQVVAAAAGGALTVPFTDSFDRTNTSAGDIGSDLWEAMTGNQAPAHSSIVSNKLQFDGITDTNGEGWLVVGTIDTLTTVHLEAHIICESASDATNYIGFWVSKNNVKTFSDGYLIAPMRIAGGNTWNIYRVVSGTPTLVGQQAGGVNINVGTTYEVTITWDVDSTDFAITANGSLLGTVSDTNAARMSVFARGGLIGRSTSTANEHVANDFELSGS